MLAGVCSAFLGLPAGLPEKNGRLPIWPIKMTTTRITYIMSARTTRPGESTTWATAAPTLRNLRVVPTGGATRSSAKPQSVRGFQTRSSRATAAIETRAASTSVSSGPMKFDTRNWTTAKTMPAVRTAGRTSTIRFHPARTTIKKPGMMIEKIGSCRPTIAESARVTCV